MAILSDQQIEEMVTERKELPRDMRRVVDVRQKRGHSEREFEVAGASGRRFVVVIRRSDVNATDFSIILAVRFENSNQLFRLRRYNGKHGQHTNKLEGNTFYAFHIHKATERYQDMGTREDTYAEPTDRYATFEQALACAIADCGFDVPPESQLSLWGE